MEESDVTNLDGIGIQKQAGKLQLICIISTLSTHNWLKQHEMFIPR